MNDQETGRNILNAVMDKRALRETDLLAFQIAITMAHPAGVMCATTTSMATTPARTITR